MNVAGPGFQAVTAEHLRRYAEEGILVVEDAFGPEVVSEALKAVDLFVLISICSCDGQSVVLPRPDLSLDVRLQLQYCYDQTVPSFVLM
jgi:hypothetical protein